MAAARNSFKICLASAVFMALAPSAWAQGIDIPMLVTGGTGPSTWMSANYAHQFGADIDNTPEQFDRDSVQVVAGHRFEVGEEVFLIGNAAYQGTYYDFAKSSATSNGQLRWNDVHQLTLMAGVGWEVGDDWTLAALLIGRSAGEGGSSFDDTLTGGGAFVASYDWSDELSTGVIIGVLSQLEDSVGLIPMPTVDWRFADGWLFHFGLVSMAYPGVGPEISYSTEDFSVGFGGSYQTRRYRLDDRTQPTVGRSIDEGIGEETSFPVFVRAGWNPNENTSIGAMVGVSLGGEIRSGSGSGTKILKEDYDPAPFAGLQASYRF